MTEALTFGGRLKETDFYRVYRLAQKGAVPAIAALLGVPTAYLAWQWRWSGLRANPSWTMTVFGPLALVLPFSLVVRHFRLRYQWRRNDALRKEVRGKVSEDGVTWGLDGEAPVTFPWSTLLRYRESQSLVLVYQTTDRWMYFFPRYFADTLEWQRFRATVSARLPAW